MQIKSFFLIAAFALCAGAASFALAKDFKASIVTYPGIPTAPLKLMFDAAAVKTALGAGCVNPILKAKVTAQNTQKTAARFEAVKLLFADGSLGEINKASKSDALAATPFTYAFDFPLSSADSAKGVSGIAASFIDAGGDDSSGKVAVLGASMNIECQVGNACIAMPDTLVVAPPLPPPQVGSIQNRVVVQRVGGDSATSAGPRGGGTFTSEAPGFPAWDTPNNAALLDTIYTSVPASAGGTSEILKARGFGFSIPSTATINGIEFIVRLKAEGAVNDDTIQFVKAGTAVGTNFSRGPSVDWPLTDTNITFGGPTQLAGVSWTPADINNSNFGINISENSANVAFIDYISAKIYYTTAGASVYDAIRGLSQKILEKFFCVILRQKCDY